MNGKLLLEFLIHHRALTNFSSAEIDYLEMPFLTKQNIFWFQVSMNYTNALKVFNDAYDFGNVEDPQFLCDISFVIIHKSSKISSLAKLEAEV